MRVLLCILLLFTAQLSFAKVQLAIDEIASETIRFERRGAIRFGPMQMFFADQSGDNYVLTCSRNNLQVTLLKSSSFSNAMVSAYLENCLEKLLELRSETDNSEKLVSLEFEYKKIVLNGKVTSRNEVFIHPQYQ